MKHNIKIIVDEYLASDRKKLLKRPVRRAVEGARLIIEDVRYNAGSNPAGPTKCAYS